MTPRCDQVVFDGWRTVSISLYMTLVGYGVLVGVPVISTAWVEMLGFTAEQVGRVAGAEFGHRACDGKGPEQEAPKQEAPKQEAPKREAPK